MSNGFFKKVSDTFKEFSKKDAAICAVVIIAMFAVGVYINKNKDTYAYKNTPDAPSHSTDVSTELEVRLENILSKINGVGKVDVMITYDAEPVSAESNAATSKPLGAIVIAEGADNLEVRIKIQQSVQTVLGIEARQVKIFEMGNN